MAMVETLQVRFEANIDALAAQLSALSAQLTRIGSALDNVGAAWASGITGGAAQVNAAALGVAQGATFASSAVVAAAQRAGLRLAQGFARGITSGSGTVMQAVNRVVNAAVARIRSALQIHSPSRVTFELGGCFGVGFAEGIGATMDQTERSAAQLAAGASAQLSSTVRPPEQIGGGMAQNVADALSAALGGTQIVVPINVDGMKLGEASIRGINRVRAGTGRLMLDI